MLQLIDRQMEVRRCVNCHVLCEDNQRMIQHQFIWGCYRASCCPKCYLKDLQTRMARGENVRLQLVNLVNEFGQVEHYLTDQFRQIFFAVTKISPDRRTARQSRLLYFMVDGVKWMGRGYTDGFFPNDIYCKPSSSKSFGIPEYETYQTSSR